MTSLCKNASGWLQSELQGRGGKKRLEAQDVPTDSSTRLQHLPALRTTLDKLLEVSGPHPPRSPMRERLDLGLLGPRPLGQPTTLRCFQLKSQGATGLQGHPGGLPGTGSPGLRAEGEDSSHPAQNAIQMPKKHMERCSHPQYLPGHEENAH